RMDFDLAEVPPDFVERVAAACTAEIATNLRIEMTIFFFKQKTAYEIGLGIPAEPLFRSVFNRPINILCRVSLFLSMALCLLLRLFVFRLLRLKRFSTLTLKVL